MACQITILSVVPHGTPQQPVSSVDVKGTATGRTTVQVSLSCGVSLTTPQDAVVDQQGNWSVTISDLTGSECNCGSDFMRADVRTELFIPNCQTAIRSMLVVYAPLRHPKYSKTTVFCVTGDHRDQAHRKRSK
jgi:hypothetical protein